MKKRCSISFSSHIETSNRLDRFYDQYKDYFKHKSNAIEHILMDFFDRGATFSSKSLKKIGIKKNLKSKDGIIKESDLFKKVSKIERMIGQLSAFSLPRLEVCRLLFPVFKEDPIKNFLDFEKKVFREKKTASKLLCLLEEINLNPSNETEVSISRIEIALNEFIKYSLPRLEVLQFVFSVLNDDEGIDFKMFSDKVLNKYFYR